MKVPRETNDLVKIRDWEAPVIHYEFPISVVINYHKFNRLKQQMYFLSVLEVRNPKAVSVNLS